MPGSERTLSSFAIARRLMTETVTEDDLFALRPDEIPRIRNGTVTLIPYEETSRVLDLLQETLRLRIDVGEVVALIRGDAFVRTRRALGDDFLYISTQTTEHLHISPIAIVMQKISRFLEARYSLDVKPADLCFEITGGEPIPNAYTLHDLVFVAATSRHRRDHFADTFKILRITLEFRPRILPLTAVGQGLL